MRRVGLSVAGALLALMLVTAPMPTIADEAVVEEEATEVVAEEELDEVADDEQAESVAAADEQEAPQKEADVDEPETPLGTAIDEEEPLESTVDEQAEPLEADAVDEADPLEAEETVNVYRLYNWRSSEHLYTTSKGEYDNLPRKSGGDWIQEGVAWVAPKTSNTPVYRLYNDRSGDHHYTTSAGERDILVSKYGWSYEQVAFYSDDSHRVALYRVYNGRLRRGQHHYTTSAVERDSLVAKSGWRDEGTGFYAVKKGSPKPPSASTIPAGTYVGREGNFCGIVINADGSCQVVFYEGHLEIQVLGPDDTYGYSLYEIRFASGQLISGKDLVEKNNDDGYYGSPRSAGPNNYVVKLSDGSYLNTCFWYDSANKKLYCNIIDFDDGMGGYIGPMTRVGDYVLPDSSKRLYSHAELDELSNIELWIARNEIYARHGRKFTNAWLQNYFNTKPWYSGKYSPSEYDVGGVPKVYNDYEGENRSRILQVEEEGLSDFPR